MKKLTIAAALLCAACASSNDDAYVPPAPPPAASEARVAELQTTLTELLERIDVLNDRIGRLEEENASLRGAPPLPAAPSAPSAAVGTSAPLGAGSGAPQRAVQPQRALVGAKIADDYRKAIMLYGRGSLTEARQQFELVLESDPSGDLADNALFWIGETYFAARDYVNAMRYYARVANEYPDQNKAPDALLKTALAQERTGDLALARKTLQQVVERYPYSTSASSAKQELQRIKY